MHYHLISCTLGLIYYGSVYFSLPTTLDLYIHLRPHLIYQLIPHTWFRCTWRRSLGKSHGWNQSGTPLNIQKRPRNAPILLHEGAEYGIATTCCYAMLKWVSPAASVPAPPIPHTQLKLQSEAVICYIPMLDCLHHLILFVTVTCHNRVKKIELFYP